ncbi:hypothetical protein [Candidatus Poriferisodalis sp.]|uniref:hypothetical protein n=1 Tax=Candidatus Poriferisodalis sp. TaxID=3101277 RepID=UPI003B0219AC
MLGAAPSTYWSAKRRPPSARALRDGELMPLLPALWSEYRTAPTGTIISPSSCCSTWSDSGSWKTCVNPTLILTGG